MQSPFALHFVRLCAASLVTSSVFAARVPVEETTVSVRMTPCSAGAHATAVVHGAAHRPFVLVGDTHWALGRYTVLAVGQLDGLGRAACPIDVPTAFVRDGARLTVRAVSSRADGKRSTSDPSELSFSSTPFERFGADYHVASTGVQPGEVIAEQWAEVGLHVHAVNAVSGPDLAIAFDSAVPTGGDLDLVTPGPGTGNDFAFGNVMIIAENSVDMDADGIIDVPDDDIAGGVLYYNWDMPVLLASTTLLDVDMTDAAGATCRTYLGGVPVESIFVPGLDDNNVQTVVFNADLRVDELQVDFSGSGAVAEVQFMPCPVVLGFDATTTGIPFGRATGEIVAEQWISQGVTISGVTNSAADPDAVILFDTANPTGGDNDLVTPGTGVDNTVARGQVLVLANDVDDADGDGLVDDPGDSNGGGTFLIEFAYDVTLGSGTVLDIDTMEPECFFEAFDGAGLSLGEFPLAQVGDNSSQTIDFGGLSGVRRLELNLCASGALAELVYCPAPDPGL